MNTFEKLERWSFTPASFWLWARNTPTTSARAQTAATLRRMTLLTMPMRFSWRLLGYEEKV